MKISDAFREASRVVRGQKSAALKFLITEGCLTLICLAPLLFLTEAAPIKYLAALTPVLWILLMLPARVNAAAAMQDSLGEGSLFSLRLADPSGYGWKLGYGLCRGLLLAIWGAPLIAAILFAWEKFAGQTDGLTVLQEVHAFGGRDMKTGMIYLLLILFGLILILLIGIGFHSGDRHARVLDQKGLMKGHRGKALLCWICSLVFLLPLLIALVLVMIRYAPLLNNLTGVVNGTVEKPGTKTTLIILGIGAALTVPLLPLRSMVTAAFVNGLRKE